MLIGGVCICCEWCARLCVYFAKELRTKEEYWLIKLDKDANYWDLASIITYRNVYVCTQAHPPTHPPTNQPTPG